MTTPPSSSAEYSVEQIEDWSEEMEENADPQTDVWFYEDEDEDEDETEDRDDDE